MSSNNKTNNIGKVSAKTRVVVATVAILGVGGGVTAVWYHHHKKSEDLGSANVVSGPRIKSIPGAGDPSDKYVATQNLQNNLLEKKARKDASSAIPTITRPSFIGNPSAFGELPSANKDSSSKDSSSGPKSCSIKKVVVMFRPNPANCTVPNLKMARKAGVTAEELACQGCSLHALKLAGYTAGELKNVGYSAKQLKDAGYSLGQLAAAGYSAKDLKKAGFTPKEIAAAGVLGGNSADCSVAHLKKERAAGVTALELKNDGCGLAGLKAAGYTAAELKKAGYTAGELKNAGFSNGDLKAAGFTSAQIAAADKASKDCSVAELKKERLAGKSAVDLRKDGCGLAALKAAGFTAAQLKQAGYTAAQLKDAGFTAKQLRGAGFTAKQLRDAGFSAAALKKAGFNASQLKAAGFNAGQLAAAGFSAKQLHDAGYTAKQLRDAGFNAAQLKQAGYTAKQLKKAGYSKGDLLRAGFTPKQSGYATAKEAKHVAAKQKAVENGASIASQMGADDSSSMPKAGSEAAKMAAMVRKEQAQMSEQQRQDSIQQLSGAMSMEANRMLSEWGDQQKQSMEGALPQTTSKSDSSSTGSGSTSGDTQSAPGTIMKAGSVMFAVLDTAVDTDEKSPIMATIVDGPLKGAKLLGQFTRVNKRVLLSFNLLNDPHYYKSIPINAVAIDPNTARTAISGQVNNHYLLKYGTVFATAFLSGLSNAVLQSNSSPQCSLFGCVNNVSPLNTRQQITVGLGTAGEKIADDYSSKFENIPPTVKIRGGTGIGILIMSDLKLPSGAVDSNSSASNSSSSDSSDSSDTGSNG